eukprot:gene12496-12630_t
MATGEATLEELQHNYNDYKEQLQQVETLLLSDPHNDELREMYDSLAEVMQLTEDLLRDAGAPVEQLSAAAAAAAALYSADGQHYPAKVKAVTDDGMFVVVYEGYGNEETWLEIKPTDDEKTVARKKKLLKSYKSKKRFQQMDVQQKERQTSWQNFQKGKGSKAKSGFFTGRKKDSMFKVPENGKVGVIGSGRGVTEYKKQTRHEFNVDE